MKKILTIAVIFLVAACSDNVGLQRRTADNRMNMAQGGQIEVKPGDTVYSIARRHNVAMSEIIKENKLQQPYVLQPGQTIRVPGVGYADNTGIIDTGSKATEYVNTRSVEGVDLGGSSAPAPGSVETTSLTPLDAAPLSPLPVQGEVEREGRHDLILTPTGPVTTPKPGEVQIPGQPSPDSTEPVKLMPETDVAVPTTQNVPSAPSAVAPAKGTFAWPVEGKAANGTGGNAVDINAPRGTAVTSASGGTVIGVTSDSVTIQHAGGYTSTYSPLERVLVDKDAIVAKGDAIGTLGSGGGSGKAAQLHFTIAKDGQPVDPVAALPAK